MSKKVDLSGEKNIPTHVVAVFAFIQKDDKYLLSKRSSSDPQSGGEWSIVSGKVELEQGQNILENTLKREVKEEVGVEIEDGVAFLGSSGFTRVSGHNVVSITFLCKWKSGVAKPLEDQEDVRWMTLRELRDFNKFPGYTIERVKMLENYLSKK